MQPTYFKKILGQNIKRLRHEANLTQQELADAIGMKTRKISDIELGKVFPKVVTIVSIINALKVEKINALFDEEPYVPTKPHKYTYAAPILRASKPRTPKSV